MKKQYLSAKEYVKKLQAAIKGWKSSEVRRAWVLTFVDGAAAQNEQFGLLGCLWDALAKAIDEKYISAGLHIFEDDLRKIFIQYSQNNLLPEGAQLQKNISSHCHKIITEAITCWALQSEPAPPVEEIDVGAFWKKTLVMIAQNEQIGSECPGHEFEMVMHAFSRSLSEPGEVNNKVSEFISLMLEDGTGHYLAETISKIPRVVRFDVVKSLIIAEETLEKAAAHYAVLYASVQLQIPLRLELEAKVQQLRNRQSSCFQMPWWDAVSTQQGIIFLDKILQLNENRLLSAVTLKEAAKNTSASFENYFDGMQPLYEKIESSLRREIIKRARTMDSGPAVAVKNQYVIDSMRRSLTVRSISVNSPTCYSECSTNYYYDVYDNEYEDEQIHTHSMSSGQKQKQEYSRAVLLSAGNLKLKNIVELRSSLCCLRWKYGFQNPPWPIKSETELLADATERDLEESIWTMSKKGPEKLRFGGKHV